MPRLSAGILLFRPAEGGGLEVLLVHPGGPLWARRRGEGTWSIPKGEVEVAETDRPLAAAEREFEEELGVAAPPGERIDLGQVTQAGGKRVAAWAVRGDLDPSSIRSQLFELEWPPRSGTVAAFPEIDEAAWFLPATARRQLVAAQAQFIDRLLAAVARNP